ncbi:MAG: hypothetical protein GX270_15560 [Clostridiaceae bacterium]|nr:hypothetical protein [Clostridiaceae bacterium]
MAYAATAAAAALTTTTDENGVVTFEIEVPALVDENDGVSVQVTLNNGETKVGEAIEYTK